MAAFMSFVDDMNTALDCRNNESHGKTDEGIKINEGDHAGIFNMKKLIELQLEQERLDQKEIEELKRYRKNKKQIEKELKYIRVQKYKSKKNNPKGNFYHFYQNLIDGLYAKKVRNQDDYILTRSCLRGVRSSLSDTMKLQWENLHRLYQDGLL